jgi:hypothetical protein
MPATDLPVRWVKKHCVWKNKSYYFNLDNGQSQWTHPSYGIRDKKGDLERLKPLEDGWYTEYCTINKLWYYYNINKRHSQWTHPSYGIIYNKPDQTETISKTYKYAEFLGTTDYDENDQQDYIDSSDLEEFNEHEWDCPKGESNEPIVIDEEPSSSDQGVIKDMVGFQPIANALGGLSILEILMIGVNQLV